MTNTDEARRMLHEGADAVWPHGDWVEDCWVCKSIDDLIEADQLRSMEREVALLERLYRSVTVMGEDGECSVRLIRGTDYVTRDDVLLLIDDHLSFRKGVVALASGR